ncbi:MAG: Gfo/Idh/MocA family oxidoreductase [Phycisphaeraceae bacterium]
MATTPANPATSTSKSSTATRKLRLAFIGAGGIAGTHIRALRKMPDVEIVALADISEAALAKHAEEFGFEKSQLFTDYEQMLEKVEPDAVDVCTPNGVHAPASIAASGAGAHVIVEKPMAMNAEQVQAMIDAAKAADRKLVIGFQSRFHPATSYLKRAYDDGVFGEIRFGRIQALRRRGIPNWGVFGRKELQGGGPLIDIGVHVLEVAHFVMGSPRPVAAVGSTWTDIGDRPSTTISQWPDWDHKTYTVEDLAVGHIRFENGAVLHVESMFAGHIEKTVWDFQLMGEKGGCTWAEPRIFTDQLGHMVNIQPGFLAGKGDFGSLFDLKLRNFVNHVLHDTPTLAPAEHGLMVQQMLDGIYRSAEAGGREVELGEAAEVV